MPKQAHTWLEKFHAWKHRIWAMIRDFVRAQFSPDSRHEIRLWQMGADQPKSNGPKVETYAQVPVLNQQQVVSVWKWTVPAHERWESVSLTVPVTDRGVYLVEATDGKLRAYTIVVITDRNDLDDQLFGTFSMCRDLIRQTPIQADSRDDLRSAGRRSDHRHAAEIRPDSDREGGTVMIRRFSP